MNYKYTPPTRRRRGSGHDLTGTASGEPLIAGWGRWVRRPLPAPDAKPAPPLVFTEDMYPARGGPARAAYVNASPEGKALYERFGFTTVQRSDFGGGPRTKGRPGSIEPS
ncbi:Uncharacterized protein TPAR_01140 [Tolypocladium paradoxum]|uniref:N-acetyltransferase domain-containing protein n=1 Tax=Tolypocladium paradoxum TaxID=94208 RepID=A0A2S4L8B7_9HYPO|nr:Uncharacterized protein TPAR_01140 [Tolypocladium paradoxum]